jgi:hypothetical protein
MCPKDSQEYYYSPEVNSFETSLAPRHYGHDNKEDSKDNSSLSSSSSSSASSSGAASTGSAASATAASSSAASSEVGAAVAGGATATVGTVILVVVVAVPLLSKAPSLTDFSYEPSSSSCAFVFSAKYAYASSIIATLDSSEASLSQEFLLLPAKEGESEENLFSGDFKALSPATNYVITLKTPISDQGYLTLKQERFTTLAADRDGQVSIAASPVDYATASLAFSLTLSDPASYLHDFYFTLEGFDSSGSPKTLQENLPSPYTATVDLSGYKKGYYLHLSVYALSNYAPAENDITQYRLYAETALYY